MSTNNYESLMELNHLVSCLSGELIAHDAARHSGMLGLLSHYAELTTALYNFNEALSALSKDHSRTH